MKVIVGTRVGATVASFAFVFAAGKGWGAINELLLRER